ncbi:HigA family addiction module antitoxin [Alistipes shahii]|jgi:addiction module HigA family antidote|uniref:HigA family addiction module antitoxin n=1 Tax=Alistipes shahii TaxID=328814 RepID=UPI0036F2307F
MLKIKKATILQTNSFALRIFATRIMKSRIDILKGIHPGKLIDRDLKKRNLSQRSFAASIGEHSQTLNAIITGRRNLTVEMALKIEQAFEYDEGFLLTLQAFYEIAEYKNRMKSRSIDGVPAIRRSLFWDADFDSIDWGRYKDAVIARVAERGSDAEKAEIARFYGIPLSALDTVRPSNAYRINATQRYDQRK